MKKGFTLIELLAVIVILAIIALIAVPLMLNVVEDSKRSSFMRSVEGAIEAVDYYLLDNNVTNMTGDGIHVSQLKAKNIEQFTSGKVITNEDGEYEAVKITNGKYCVSGIIGDLKITSNCSDYDVLPNVTLESSSTSNKITLIATPTNGQTEITNYEFALNGGEYTNNGVSNTIIYSNLPSGSYDIKVRVTNKLGVKNIFNKSVSTANITIPTYAVSPSGFATSKTVTITYPTRETGFIYQYSINEGTSWTTVASGVTANVVFNNNGSIIARIYDGTNYDAGANTSFTVAGIDTTAPSAPTISSINNPHYDSIIATFTQSVDAESGINSHRCIYGQTSTVLSSTGTISGNTCTITPIHTHNFANTPYYFKVCGKNNAGTETCSNLYGPVASSYCASYYHGFNENYSACVGGIRTYNKYYVSSANSAYICAITPASEAC